MSRGANQKFKIYRLAQIMLERTDEEHYLTMPEIIAALKEYDIPADRKSLYADLKDLEILGIEVEGAQIGHISPPVPLHHIISRFFIFSTFFEALAIAFTTERSSILISVSSISLARYFFTR